MHCLPLLALLTACFPDLEAPDLAADPAYDLDGDGFSETDGDCDDTSAAVHPGATERCNGIDDDCDGSTDGADAVQTATWYRDEDGDGYGDDGATETACDAPSDYVDQGGDCVPDDDSINPGASEVWYDGDDSDCEGASDFDADGDGFDSDAYEGTDCDDSDPAIYPGAREQWYDGVDQDCSGTSDYDADGDGSDALPYDGTDCDDDDEAVNPGADDAWYDGTDSNCDEADDYDADGDGQDSALYGGWDCDDENASVSYGAVETWYDGTDSDCSGGSDYDADGDGAELGDDCDDADATAYPGAIDPWYDGVDSNCDGADDHDADADGYDSDTHGGEDCDDSDAEINPGVGETWYDGVDSDCDGENDYDADGDGQDSALYGGWDCDDDNASVSYGAVETWYDGTDSDCSGGSDYDADGDGAELGDDCDDADAAAYPGAIDPWYDGVDSNCDGADDHDADADGYDSDTHGGEDCDDSDAEVNPGVGETWYDGVDSDCDGENDYDADGDGYMADAAGGLDCDDGEASTHPGATEAWYDGVDADCDGWSDYDADGDGYDSEDHGGDDCEDAAMSSHPDAPEVFDLQDNDCDGSVDEGFSAGDAQTTIQGGSTSTRLSAGWPSPYVGDFDGDGIEDLAVVATDGASASYPNGVAYLISGLATGTIEADAEEFLQITGSTQHGLSHILVADIDASGSVDVVTWQDGRAGYTRDDLNIYLDPAPEDELGYNDEDAYIVSSTSPTVEVIDFTALDEGASDSRLSLIVCDQGSYYGRAQIYRGTYSGTMTAGAVFDGEYYGDQTARTVGVGDMDGDGSDEIVLGGPRAYKNAADTWGAYAYGYVYIFYDASAWSGSYSVADSDAGLYGSYAMKYGAELGSPGDVDGDGLDDLTISSEDSTRAFLVTGTPLGENPMGTIALASFVDANLGASLWEDEADFNGDGNLDLFFGDSDNDEVATDAGKAYLFFGPFGSGSYTTADASASIDGGAEGDYFGGYSGSVGDLNDDGATDFMVGAMYNDDAGAEYGASYLFLSATP